jgi:hypothetical protein
MVTFWQTWGGEECISCGRALGLSTDKVALGLKPRRRLNLQQRHFIDQKLNGTKTFRSFH